MRIQFWMQGLRKVVVTGCNKGIGFGLASKLVTREGWHVIMAVRNLQLGEQAMKEILNAVPTANISLQRLDVSDPASVIAFKNIVSEKYKQVDVIINNAGVAAKGDAFDLEVIDTTFATNFYGTINFTESLLSLISKNGKIITLGSMAGRMTMGKMGKQLKERFKNPNISQAEVLALAEQFRQAVADNTFIEKGWPKWSYGVSKLCLNILLIPFSQRKEILEKGVQVYNCCPGYVKTDMTSHKGVLTVEQGITTPMYLFDLPFQLNPTLQGQFFEKSAVSTTFA